MTADAGRPSLILFALLFSAMAETLAAQTSAGIHLTFLDAYVPKGWDPKALGALSADPCHVCRTEHYFTRGRVEHLTENLLAHAHNVDITSINPGFDSHNFPRHWYASGRPGKACPLLRLCHSCGGRNPDIMGIGIVPDMRAHSRYGCRLDPCLRSAASGRNQECLLKKQDVTALQCRGDRPAPRETMRAIPYET